MEIIDNLIYTVLNNTAPLPTTDTFLTAVDFDYLDVKASMGIVGTLPSVNSLGDFSYSAAIRDNFLHLEDTSVIEKGIQKHWFDIGNRLNYPDTIDPLKTFTNLQIPPYHLMYAYLIENTRIA